MAAQQLFSTLFNILHPLSNYLESDLALSCFRCQIQIYWSGRRMEFELDEGHWLFLIFDFTSYPGHLASEDGPFFIQWPAVKLPKIKTFRTSKPSFLLFPCNEAAFLLPVHWWWDRMLKMWQIVGRPTWKYYFLTTPHLLLSPVWELPFGQHLQNLPPHPKYFFKRIRERNCRKVLCYEVGNISPYEFPWERWEVESWRWHDGEFSMNWDVSFRNGHHL